MQSLSSSSLTQTSQVPLQSSTREPFLVIENVSKIYPTPKGPYSVVEDVNLTVYEGEFVCLIGHSGCGKSTLLNMVAGFLKPSEGEVKLRGSLITKPGPDRMMVFQNYSLLPWKTAFENVDLAVKSAYPNKSKAERAAIVEEHLAMVGLTESANKRPSQLSGGMKQRVAIARALAIRPQVLILDEPFGALDAITKEELQEELLQIWREFRVTILMITHDIDEALFLADRLVMMTNGPAANIGEVLEIPFTRPRNRASIMEDPRYYDLRNYALDFLFRRFAHSEEPAPANTTQEVMTSNKTEPVTAVSQTENPTATVEKKDIPISAARPNLAVKIASTIALTAFTAFMVNGWMRQISEVNTAKQAQTQESVVSPATPTASEPTTTPAATSTLTSPAATSPATTPTTTSTLTSPAATSSLNLTEAIPQSAPVATPEAIATTSTSEASAPDAGVITSTSEASAPAATPEASATTSTSTVNPTTTTSQTSAAQKITAPAQLEELNGNIYKQIDQSWQTTPTFAENLVYRVKVKPDGEIVSYEGVNQAASDYIQETPLPSLVKSAGSQTAETTPASFAEFKVVLSPAGTLEVTPW